MESGHVLYSNNGEKMIRPASTHKLLVSAAALDLLGPDYRFTTRLYRRTDRRRRITWKYLLARWRRSYTIACPFRILCQWVKKKWVSQRLQGS